MNWVAFLCFMIVQHCTSGAAGAVTQSVVVDTLGRVLSGFYLLEQQKLLTPVAEAKNSSSAVGATKAGSQRASQ